MQNHYNYKQNDKRDKNNIFTRRLYLYNETRDKTNLFFGVKKPSNDTLMEELMVEG